ncbi:MAG: hypothetical protein IPK66_05915 [Rhodospirillales bacterium]|nr:hypothetical protein [Rhodospirillales bacterium]
MIRLDLKREPHWLDLGHGVRLHVRPCTTALMMAARAEVQRIAAPVQNEAQAAGERTAALVKALARLSLLDWDGVGDADGLPAALTHESIDALMDLWPIASAFESAYLGPALLLDAEKNALGPAPNGTSAAGPDTARAA